MSNYSNIQSAKKQVDITFYIDLVKFGEVKVPPKHMQYFKERIAMVEKRANINVAEYIDFGSKGTAQYKFHTGSAWNVKYCYIGEMN